MCVCVCGAIAQLVRDSSYGVITSGTLQGCRVKVTVMVSYGIISLGKKKLTHNCLTRLGSINEYLVFDWGGKGLQLRQSPSATGVRVGLRVPTPQLASQSVLLRAPGQAPGDCLAWTITPA